MTAKTTIDRRAPAYAQEVSKSFGPASAKHAKTELTAKLAKLAKACVRTRQKSRGSFALAGPKLTEGT